jgi:ABC-type multidrug transport system fused ATPase/permease subunit
MILMCVLFVVCYARGARLYQILPLGLAAIAAYRPIKQLTQVNANLQRGSAAMHRICEVLDTDTALPDPRVPVRMSGFKERIVFDHVSFRYDSGNDAVLDDISVEIPRGSVVALVGETGSGKTTFADLVARFYDPTEGRVLLDGVDLRDIDVADLRRMIGVVTQETVLFNDTIAGNIAYGSREGSREEIVEAARKANAHEFIQADPAGYERVVGEKGFVLSGGQRQRIALARAILKDAPILILDEATSALDTVTERLVQQAVARAMEGHTVLAIAHRLSTVRNADRIYLLEKGRIVEQGTHDELYAEGGRYRKLCDMQMMDG